MNNMKRRSLYLTMALTTALGSVVGGGCTISGAKQC